MQLGSQLAPINLAAGNNNDLTGSGGILTAWRLIPHASGSTLTGLDASLFHDMDLVFIRNDSATVPLTIAHQSSASSAANRFTCPNSTDVTVAPHGCVVLLTDGYGISVGPVGIPGPAGATGSTGSTGATGATGDDGDAGAGFGTITLSSPTRVAGTAFQPSTTAPTLVSYAARVAATLPLLGTAQEGYYRLKSDASNPPTTVRGVEVGAGVSATAAVVVSQTVVGRGTLSYLVPPGHWVMIEAITVGGTPAFSLGAQTEEVLA